MNKTQIHAEIVADSVNQQGDRLTSLLITFPRILLSEINTHRMLSKNTSSSRAIPFKKMVEVVLNNPFIPIAWQKEHKGMQGNEYFTTLEQVESRGGIWLRARDKAIQQAETLNGLGGVTKQLCNRLLEPFMWTTMLITGSREGWQNFFELRCPSYEWEYEEGTIKAKSKEEFLEMFIKRYPTNGEKDLHDWEAVDEHFNPIDSNFWRSINKGQAEIHIMDLSEKIYDAMNESTPKQLKADQWHIPMISDLESLKLSTDDQIKLSVGRAANTSYTVVGDGKKLTLEQAVRIHDKCKELNHSSVFEHCARAMSDDEYYTFVKGRIVEENKREDGTCDSLSWVEASGWCNNLKGFIPYRYFIDNKIEL